MKPISKYIKKEPEDYIQLRLVVLDDYDRVVEVVYTSKKFPPQDRWGKDISNINVDIVLDRVKPHHNYDFYDYETNPPMEIQALRKSTNEWVNFSDPVEDYFNM